MDHTPRLGRPKETLYLGRRAITQSLNLTKSSTGLRVVIYRWIDSAHPDNGGYKAGTVVLRLMSGSFLRNPRTFNLIETDVLVPDDEGNEVSPVVWLKRAYDMLLKEASNAQRT